jgi:hypothetical protein
VTCVKSTRSSASAPLAAVAPSNKLEPPMVPVERLDPARSKSEPLSPLIERPTSIRKTGQVTGSVAPLTSTKPPEGRGRSSSVLSDSVTSPVPAAQPKAPRVSTSDNTSQRNAMSVGEDDLAIFEQMRLQLVLWLRIEAISAGLEIAGQGPTQLLEMLRKQSRIDETRLQVVSTLLNLTNQVIKTGTVTVLDYKQALMFHLMHTRRV